MRGTRRRRAQTQRIHGAPDMLLLKVVALGSIRGYLICQRIQQVSTDVLQLYRMEQKKWLSAGWRERKAAGKPNFTRCRDKGGSSSRLKAAAWTRRCHRLGDADDRVRRARALEGFRIGKRTRGAPA